MKNYCRILGLYLKEHKFLSTLILVVIWIQAVIIISFQVAYKEIFDGVADKKTIEFIMVWIVVILIAAVLRILIGLCSDYLVGKMTLKIFGKIRMILFHQLQWLPADFYQRVQVGELVSHYSHDLQHSEMVTRQVLPLIIRSIFLATVSLMILFFFNWQLTLFALALFPFVFFGVLLFMKKAQEATKRNQRANAKLSTMLEEVATQHLLLQAFNLQKPFLKRFKENLESYETQFLSGIFLRTLVGRTSVFGLSIVEILVFSVGALMTIQGLMSIGTLFGFFALIWNISGAVSTISDVLPNLIEAGGHMQRLQELLTEKTDIPVPLEGDKKQINIPSFREKISLNHVSLRHGETYILKDLTFEILPGQYVGIVGSTGSGKTSFLSLLMGFYTPTEGQILFDGHDLVEIDRELLRSKIGLVFQHNPLFNLTLRENIRIGKMDSTDEEIIQAAKAAEIHDFIVSLPEGYNTLVKEYGTNLSGGQKQRIALARVYLRNPSLLLLDEPTSALDSIVENQINQAISKLARGKTVLLCTHRLASLKTVDQIFVLEKGELVERGTHASLMEKKGTYFDLWQKQNTVILKEAEKPIIDLSLLKNIPKFQDFDEKVLKEIAKQFVTEWREDGSVIYENEYLEKFFLIVKGRVEVRDPKLSLLSAAAVLEEGDYFGGSTSKEARRELQVKALSHCIFLTLRNAHLKEVLSKFFLS